MLVSIIRFALKGWIYELYIAPVYHFTFYGFDWVQPLDGNGMYVVFVLMGLAAACIMLGFKYRIATVSFFLLFTYVELIDKSNYLNHYYFVSILSFLLILVPAHRGFSFDVFLKPALRVDQVPAWTINIFKLQLGIVYFYAGLAKLNTDWLFEAMPLSIWLPAMSHLPLIGQLFAQPETAFVFSWAGAIYDLTIVFFLLYHRTRPLAYVAVICFHLMTALLFQIGMFPYIMILCTLIYFSAGFHERLLESIAQILRRAFSLRTREGVAHNTLPLSLSKSWQYALGMVIVMHFALQLIVPFRSALYPGTLFWTEQGYRFSWRVMLMEKAGYTVFNVNDPASGRSWEIANWDYLTPNQEKMMATQPDMMLQFAHFLEAQYQAEGIKDVAITADAFVALNGRRSRRFIDPTVDLTKEERGFATKEWILPFDDE